jgi:hypothetical protein
MFGEKYDLMKFLIVHFSSHSYYFIPVGRTSVYLYNMCLFLVLFLTFCFLYLKSVRIYLFYWPSFCHNYVIHACHMSVLLNSCPIVMYILKGSNDGV